MRELGSIIRLAEWMMKHIISIGGALVSSGILVLITVLFVHSYLDASFKIYNSVITGMLTLSSPILFCLAIWATVSSAKVEMRSFGILDY